LPIGLYRRQHLPSLCVPSCGKRFCFSDLGFKMSKRFLAAALGGFDLPNHQITHLPIDQKFTF
jgi:hypothetical protein